VAFGRPWRVVDELPTDLVDQIGENFTGGRSLLMRSLDQRDIAEELVRAISVDPWPYTSMLPPRLE